jgi:hypothetical protein
MELKEHL